MKDVEEERPGGVWRDEGEIGEAVATRIEIEVVFFFNDTATTEIYTLSLHGALPILRPGWKGAGLRTRKLHKAWKTKRKTALRR